MEIILPFLPFIYIFIGVILQIGLACVIGLMAYILGKICTKCEKPEDVERAEHSCV